MESLPLRNFHIHETIFLLPFLVGSLKQQKINFYQFGKISLTSVTWQVLHLCLGICCIAIVSGGRCPWLGESDHYNTVTQHLYEEGVCGGQVWQMPNGEKQNSVLNPQLCFLISCPKMLLKVHLVIHSPHHSTFPLKNCYFWYKFMFVCKIFLAILFGETRCCWYAQIPTWWLMQYSKSSSIHKHSRLKL